MQNTDVVWNWRTVNVPTIITVLVTATTVVTYFNGLDSRLSKIEEYRQSRSMVTDRKFEDIQDALDPLRNTPYRITVLEQQATATNQRIDRFAEIITTNLELLRKDVNALSTKVEVLAQKIDSLTPEKRAELDTLPSELIRR